MDWRIVLDVQWYAQLLSSRLCHDLITPINAVYSGIELLQESATQDAETLDVLAQSAQTALRRLVFFRTAFGSGTAKSFTSLDPVETCLRDYCTPIGIDLTLDSSFENEETVDFPLLGRMMLNLSLIACDMAPHGGSLTLSILQDHGRLHGGLTLEGSIFEMREDIRTALTGKLKEADLSPQTIQAFMTWELLDRLQLSIAVNNSTKSLLSCQISPKESGSLMEAALF